MDWTDRQTNFQREPTMRPVPNPASASAAATHAPQGTKAGQSTTPRTTLGARLKDALSAAFRDLRASCCPLQALYAITQGCSVARHAPFGLILIDERQRVCWSNARAATLLGADLPRGQALQALNLAEISSGASKARLRRDGPPLGQEVLLNGRTLWLQHQTLQSWRGERVQIAITDISGLLRTVDAREQHLRMLAHDLLSPQSSIVALTRLHDSDPIAFKACGGLERIGELAMYTRTLSRDFIELSMPADQARHRFTRQALGLLVGELIEGVRPCAQLSGVSLIWQDESGGATLPGLRGPLLRALQNLIVNAMKASEAGQVVEVNLRRVGESLLLCVSDQAGGLPGLSPGLRRTRFNDLPRPAGQQGGYGIGLEVVRRVADLHRGALYAELHTLPDADPNTLGTRFTLSLPLSDAGAQQHSRPMPFPFLDSLV